MYDLIVYENLIVMLYKPAAVGNGINSVGARSRLPRAPHGDRRLMPIQSLYLLNFQALVGFTSSRPSHLNVSLALLTLAVWLSVSYSFAFIADNTTLLEEL